MAHIIVPTDFSENAYNALFYATRLYPNEACKIKLVHSFESQFSGSTSRIDIGRNEQLYDALEEEAFMRLEKEKNRIILDSEGISVMVDIVTSAQPLFKIVNKLIVDTNVDFVVMGTKGASGLKEVFLGTQAVKLIKKVKPIPIFVVPQQADFRVPDKVAYATDLKIDYAQYSLEIIKEVMHSHNSKLYITHIYNQMSPEQTVETNYRKLKQKLLDVEYTTHWLSSDTKMEDSLGTFIQKHGINLLVLMYHKSGFLKRLFKKSFVEKASFRSEIPILILPESF